MKKAISVILTLLLLASSLIPAAAAADTGYSDVSGHWASKEIAEWSQLGVVQGYDDAFRPDAVITRGELAVILDRILQYQYESETSFSDLNQAFYTQAIQEAVYAGVLEGYGDDTVRPNDNVTRQDAMCMLVRAFDIQTDESGTLNAPDASQVSEYARDAVSALVSGGIVHGRGDGRIDPQGELTRAEMIKLLDNLIAGIISTPGTSSVSVNGMMVVNTAGVALTGATIHGDLLLAPGAGNGDITLKNINVTGNLVVLGGGTVTLSGSSRVSGVTYLNKMGAAVTLNVGEKAQISGVVIQKSSADVALSGTFETVTVNAGSVVTLLAGTTVKTLLLNAPAHIEGEGTVTAAVLSQGASGAVFAAMPGSITGPSGVQVQVNGTTYVSDGTSFSETGGTSGGSSGGGSSGGGSSGGGSGETSVKVTGVTLYVNGDTAIAASTAKGGYQFDLTGQSDDTCLSGIQITTNDRSNTVFQVGTYSVATNQRVTVSTLLGMLGISTSKSVTLEKLRDLGDSCSVTGTIGSVTLTLRFALGDAGPYTISTVTKSGATVITAQLDSSFSDILLSEADTVLGVADPVKLLVSSIADTTDSYQLTVTNGALTFKKTYTYSDISALDMDGLLDKISAKGSYETLGDLTGLTITIVYGSNTLTLVFT
ncbi:MAG: beta-propeller protein, methanol dehydrogenase [Oscillospiraceae bacterium]|nr:beta-propeller protein, methanol dehydrogenase [Oscillospiraceae bacterium]